MLLHRLGVHQLWISIVVVATLSVVAIGALPPPRPSSSCQRKCGGVDIPYPFGIGPDDSPDHCSLPGFNLSCKDDGHGVLRPFYIDVEIQNILLQQGQARMRMDMSTYCYNTSAKEMEGHTWILNLAGTPYRFSDTGNMFTVVGCRTLAYIGDEDNVGRYMSGCVSMCRQAADVSSLSNGSCSGIGCCTTAIPKDLQYYKVWFDPGFNTSEIYNTSRCSYAALIEESSFTFSTSYATSAAFFDAYGGQPPLLVDWAIGNETCKVAKQKPGGLYACVDDRSECFDSANGPGYICNCSKGFQGNPYLVDGCKGNKSVYTSTCYSYHFHLINYSSDPKYISKNNLQLGTERIYISGLCGDFRCTLVSAIGLSPVLTIATIDGQYSHYTTHFSYY